MSNIQNYLLSKKEKHIIIDLVEISFRRCLFNIFWKESRVSALHHSQKYSCNFRFSIAGTSPKRGLCLLVSQEQAFFSVKRK